MLCSLDDIEQRNPLVGLFSLRTSLGPMEILFAIACMLLVCRILFMRPGNRRGVFSFGATAGHACSPPEFEFEILRRRPGTKQ